MNRKQITLIGAPTSAGAYGPGQEKTPDALRRAGLITFLQNNDVEVTDKENVPGFRWEVDKTNVRAMNVEKVSIVARALAKKVADALDKNEKVLVIGGDCSIELGSIAGCLNKSSNIGLIYIDLDTDLNTPQSVEDGALDWMGVAHLLKIEGTDDTLSSFGPKVPMLQPYQIYFFANGNMTDFEKRIIKQHNIKQAMVNEVALNPAGVARKICQEWGSQFEHLLIHLDTDVLDFIDMPLAENYRRNVGLTFNQLIEALEEFLRAPNWSVLTITEINPDHGSHDGSTLRVFSERLATVIGEALAK